MQAQTIPTILLLLLLSSLLSLSQGFTKIDTHINTKTPTLDFSNAGYLSKIGFPFKLSRDVLKTEYIKITFPFSIHTTVLTSHPKYSQLNIPTGTNFVIPKDVTVTWDTGDVDNGCSGINDEEKASVFTWNEASTEYYVQLFDSNLLNMQIESLTWYRLWINFTDTSILNDQKSESIFTVKMETVSSAESYPQIYDDNPAFSFFTLLEAPKNTLNVTAFFNNIENDNPEQGNHELEETNCMTIDMQASEAIDSHARIIYKMTDNGFVFINNCTSEEKTTLPLIAKKEYNFSCRIDTDMNALIVELDEPLEQYGWLRIQTYSKNPNFITEGAIEVRTMKRYTPNIIEYGISSDFLYSNPIEWQTHNLNLAWNLNLDRSVADLPIILNVIRGDAQSPNYCPYNSFRVNFQTKTTTPSGVKLKLIMKVQAYAVNGEEPDILSGSLSENLPKLTNESPEVECKIYNRTDGDNRKIICTNVGQLLNTQEYHIGFQMYFPFDIGTEEIDLEYFGTLEVFAYNEYLLDYNDIPLILLSRPNNAETIPTQNSLNWQQSADPTIISSQDSACKQLFFQQYLKAYTIAEKGIHLSSNAQRLFFTINAAYEDIDPSTTTNDIGIRILMNPIFTGTAPLTPKRETSGSPFGVTATFETSTSTSEATYSLLQFYSTAATLQLAFPTARAEKQISFDSIYINTAPSMFVDQNLYDFYLVAYEQITAEVSIATPKNYVLVNAYCMTPFNNLSATISNYWATSTEILSGSYIPIILRLSGNLLSGESTDVTSFAVFFDNLDFFTLNDLAAQKFSIDANSSRNNNVNSKFFKQFTNFKGASSIFYGYSHTKQFVPCFYSLSRVEFNLTSPGSSFTAIIPLKNRVSQSKFNIYIAAMKEHPNYSGKTYKMIKMIYKQTVIDLSAGFPSASLDPDISDFTSSGANTLTYGLDVTSGYYSGAVQDVILKAGHNPGAVGTAGSAGFTYVLSLAESLLEWQYATPTFTGSCLGFKYFYIDSVDSNNNEYKYGIFCSLSAGAISTATEISLKNLKIPYETGKNLLGYGGYSASTGHLHTLQKEGHTTSGTQTLIFNSISPSTLVKGVKNYRLLLNFTTKNFIQSGAIIQLQFMNSVNFISNEDGVCMIKQVNAVEFPEQTCTISMPTSTQVRYKFTGIEGKFQPDNYLIYHYGVDNQNSNGVDTTVAVQIVSREDDDSGFISDQSNFKHFTYLNDQTSIDEQAPSLNLTVTAKTNNKKATSILYLKIQAFNTFFYRNTQILINLGQIAWDNQNNKNLRCQLLDDYKILNRNWKLLDQSSLDRLKLQVKEDITRENATFYLQCFHTILPFTSISTTNIEEAEKISASIILPSSERVLYQSNSIEYLPNCSDTSLGGGNLLLSSKLANTYGSITSLVFAMQIPIQSCSLNSSSQLLITFPYYYPAGISSTGELQCAVNNIEVICKVIRSRVVLINNLVEINSTTQDFEVRVSGGVMGQVSSTEQGSSTFWLSVIENYQEGEDYFCAQGAIEDNSAEGSEKLVSQLFVESVVTNQQFIREDRSLSCKIYLENSVDTDQVIIVRTGGLKEGGVLKSIVCYLIQGEENVVSTCEIIDQSIRITVLRVLEADQWVQLTLSGWRVTDYSICVDSKDLLTIEILSSNGTVVAGSQKLVNAPGETFYKNSAKRGLGIKWKSSNSAVTSIGLIRGIYSEKLVIYPLQDSGYFGSEVDMECLSANFSLYPADIKLNLGHEGMELQIAMPQEMERNRYLLGFGFVNDLNYYENLPLVDVTLENSQKSVQLFQYQEFDIPIDSDSTYIELKLNEDELPESNIVLQFVLSNYTNGINIYPKKFTFNASLSTCEIQVKCDIARSKVRDTNEISLVLSGDNADSYHLSIPKIYLTVVEALKNDPILTADSTQLTTIFESYEVNVKCDQPGVIYYQLFVDEFDCYELNQTQIINEVDLNYELDSNTTCQQQFNHEVIHRADTYQLITLSPIVSNLKYKFRGFCVNSNNNYGKFSKLTFNSENNQGQVVKIKVEMDVSDIKLVTSDKIRMCCYFANYFNLPVEYIQCPFNIYCYSQDYNYRRQLLEYYNTFDQTSYGETILPRENLTFLFHPITIREKDLSYLTVQSLASTALEELKNDLEGIPMVNQIYDSVEINQYITVDEPGFGVVEDLEWIALLGINADNDGYIYICFYEKEYKDQYFDQMPAFEIKQGSSYRHGEPLVHAKYHYEKASDEIITHNFTGLKMNTSYELFVVATREDLSLWPTFSYVIQQQVSTNITAMESVLLVFRLGMMILIFLFAELVH